MPRKNTTAAVPRKRPTPAEMNRFRWVSMGGPEDDGYREWREFIEAMGLNPGKQVEAMSAWRASREQWSRDHLEQCKREWAGPVTRRLLADAREQWRRGESDGDPAAMDRVSPVMQVLTDTAHVVVRDDEALELDAAWDGVWQALQAARAKRTGKSSHALAARARFELMISVCKQAGAAHRDGHASPARIGRRPGRPPELDQDNRVRVLLAAGVSAADVAQHLIEIGYDDADRRMVDARAARLRKTGLKQPLRALGRPRARHR